MGKVEGFFFYDELVKEKDGYNAIGKSGKVEHNPLKHLVDSKFFEEGEKGKNFRERVSPDFMRIHDRLEHFHKVAALAQIDRKQDGCRRNPAYQKVNFGWGW